MEKTALNMDIICTILMDTLRWVSLLESVPVVWADHQSTAIHTAPRPFLELAFHASGSESDMKVGERNEVSEPGTFMILNAHFGNAGIPRQTWRFWCVSLDTSTFSPMADLSKKALLFCTKVRSSKRIEAQYRRVASAYNWPGSLREIKLKIELLKLLTYLYEDIAGTAVLNGGLSPTVAAAVEYLQRNISDAELTLGSIARFARVSTPHLGRLFLRDLRITPMRYVTRLRMARACQLLGQRRLNVGEVGFAVGFKDRLHFSRVFRQHLGKSPKAYRQSINARFNSRSVKNT